MMKKILFATYLFIISAVSYAQRAAEPIFDKDHLVDYLVVYDESNPAFIESQGGREAYAEKVVESINEVFENSRLDYRFRLAGTYYWKGYQAPSIVDGLEALSQSEKIKEIRRETKADIVVLLTEKEGDVNSGLADHHDDAIHHDAYCCVNLSMAASKFSYTAAHEAGHILGCYHSRDVADHSASTHPWAAAYIHIKDDGTKVGTVMNTIAVNKIVPIFSGPYSSYDGIIMGDNEHDNLRIVRHNLPKVVLFGEHLEPDRYYSSADELVFSKHEQVGKLTVYGNKFMMISSNDDWIKNISPSFCNVEEEITFNISRNDSGAARTGSVILSGDAESTKTIKITQTSADIVLDCDKGSYKNEKDDFVSELCFMREFCNTNWQPLYIPFIWRYSDWKDLFDIARVESMDMETEDNATLTIACMDGCDVQPNRPYLIRAKKVGKKIININNVNLFAASEDSTVYNIGNKKFIFAGSYNSISAQDVYNNGYYELYDGSLVKRNNVESILPAYRWYLKICENGLAVHRTINITIDDKRIHTGFAEDVLNDNKSTRCVYDLNGRHVKNIESKEYMRGVYIIDGKKVAL